MKKILCLIPVVLLAFIGCKPQSSTNHLFVYTTMNEELARKILDAFQKETGITVEFVRLSTGEAAARIEAERNNPQASIWLGGVGLGHEEAKQKGLTTPYEPTTAKEIGKQYRDPEHYWTGFLLETLAFASNREKLKKAGLQAPTSWKDLTHPKLKNEIQISNPGTSGTAYNVLTTLITKNGESGAFEFLKDLHKNVSQYTRSGAAPAKNVAIGEGTVAIGYAHDILKLIYDSKAPLEITFPQDGAGYEVDAISLIKNGKQLELAKKLFDWMFTKTPSEILMKDYATPILTHGAENPSAKLLPKDLKLVDSDIVWAGKNKQRLVDLWNEMIKG